MISSTVTVLTRLRATLRSRQEHAMLLPTGPFPADPWSGSPELDGDRGRVLADLAAAPRTPDVARLEPRTLAWSRRAA